MTIIKTQFTISDCFFKSGRNLRMKKFAIFSLLFCFFYAGVAQNTSYKLNSIPINGINNSAFGTNSLLSNTTGVNNSAFGFNSLVLNTTGSNNCAFGTYSLYYNTTGSSNVAIGIYSLHNNTIGEVNTAIGQSALWKNTTGSGNTALGQSTLASNISGRNNTAVGQAALGFNTVGNYNNAIGYGSLFYNTTGSINTAIGYYSLLNNTTGSNNTAIGYYSLLNNTTGSNNIVIGNYANTASASLTNAIALGNNSIVNASNTIQLGNAAITEIYAGVGTNAKLITGDLQVSGGILGAGKVLTSDAVGNATWQTPNTSSTNFWSLTGNAGTVDGTNFIGTTDNVALNFRVNNKQAGKIDPALKHTFYGIESGINTTSGFENTALGFHSLHDNINSSQNVSIGSYSLRYNISGNKNVAVGYSALDRNTTGFENIAIGSNAMARNSIGYRNIGIGLNVLENNIAGNWNIAIGDRALVDNKTGEHNIAIGLFSINQNNLGEGNIGIGKSTLGRNTDGKENVSVGSAALFINETGSYNSAIGAYSTTSTSNLTFASAFGSRSVVNASYKIRLGDVNVSVVEGPVSYTPSDVRFKNNINYNEVKGLSFINLLHPVVYNFDTRKFEEFLTKNMPDSIRNIYLESDFSHSTAIRQTGFIAQEVEEAANAVGYDFNGVHKPETKDDNYSIAYSQFVVPLVKAVQELSTQNTALKHTLDEQAKVNETLKNDMAELRTIVSALKNNTVEGSIKITENTSEAKLYQNAPNPFSKTTTIKYSIPTNAKRAAITITTMDGNKIKTYELNSKNGQGLDITGGQLSAGTYIYSLVVDDAYVDSKKMILTK
jgi:trimeric autotransporter adhesin